MATSQLCVEIILLFYIFIYAFFRNGYDLDTCILKIMKTDKIFVVSYERMILCRMFMIK